MLEGLAQRMGITIYWFTAGELSALAQGTGATEKVNLCRRRLITLSERSCQQILLKERMERFNGRLINAGKQARKGRAMRQTMTPEQGVLACDGCKERM
jgi:hypothetical protein